MTATTRTINQNFIIRIRWNDIPNSSKLVGAGVYPTHIGDTEIAQKHFNKVLNGSSQKYTFRLRRGLKIEFYSK